ncbi:MAG: hypothetical protein FIA82_14045 [Melioribacter sp.]|nr:hypothetical protein [Melioribacter sp.]
MKLTNKILLVFLILLVLSVTAYKIVFDSKVELLPNPFDKKTTYTYIKIPIIDNNLSEFELRGRFIVNFKQRDTSRVTIEGPDNLINHYLSVEQQGNKFSVHSKIDLSKYSEYIRVYFFIKNLKTIKASGGVVISSEEFTGDTLDVSAYDSSVVRIKYCKLIDAQIMEKDKSMVILDKTKNATIHLYDYSNLLLTLDGGEVNGAIENNTDFGIEGKIKMNNVLRMNSNQKHAGGQK